MTENLPDEIRKDYFDNLNEIEYNLMDYLNYAKISLHSLNGKELRLYSECFVDIIIRFRFNVESLLALLPVYRNDYRNKLSVNILLRSICSDILTGRYLLTFTNKDDENEALGNELKAISSEFIEAVLEIFKTESDTLESYQLKPKISLDQKIEWLRINYSDFFGNDGEPLKRRNFNKIDNSAGNKKSQYGSFLTEKSKYARLKELKQSDYGFIFNYFKYYSQFQHYNSISHGLLTIDPLLDVSYMKKTLRVMKITSEIMLKKIHELMA